MTTCLNSGIFDLSRIKSRVSAWHRHFEQADARRTAQAVSSHWEVENLLHWFLDVQFNEDPSTVHTGFAANNLAFVRHIVMNLLRLNNSCTGSIKTKRMLAATSDQFRAEALDDMTLR